MKKSNDEMIRHRLDVGERFKCGELFIVNLDGYTSSCIVECQLCEDRSICSLTEFVEHIDVWHSDWEDELQQDEMQKVADEFASSLDEVVQPFEKVLIVTETKTAFSESEESWELSEQCQENSNDIFDSYNTESVDDSVGIAYTVNVADILQGKAAVTATRFEHCNEDTCNSNDTTSESTNFEELKNEVYTTSFDSTELEQISSIIEKEQSNFVEVEVEGEDEDEDENIEHNNLDNDGDGDDDNLIDRSEDSGVERSEVSSLCASTPQHLTSEDEANFEPKKLSIKEQMRIALNEPTPKSKLTTVHMEKLIEIYESHPRLWQRSHPEYNIPQLCRKSWKELARAFNKACLQNFSIRDLRVRVSTLCQRYLKERRRREMAYEIHEPKIGIISRFKYFDKLKFLDTQQNVPYSEYNSRLAQEQEKLLEIYSHFPLLWSNTDRHYDSLEQRDKAYNDMSTALQLLGIHIPPKIIRQRLTTLRKRYRLEKMRHLHCKLQGKIFETSFKQYEKMQFLDRYIAPFVCDTCGKIFRKIADYQTHIKQNEHGAKEQYADSSDSTRNSVLTMSNEKTNFQKEAVPIEFITDFGESIEELENQNLLEENAANSNHRTTTEKQENNTQVSLLPLQNALRDSFLENSNSSNGTELNSLKDPVNDFDNLLEVPIVLHNLECIEDLRDYFNGDQFFTLTTAYDSTPCDLDNHMPLKELTIDKDNFIQLNTVLKKPLNNLQTQTGNFITLQVLEDGEELPTSNTNSFVPIELVLSKSVNDLLPSPMQQESEHIEIVREYLNENSFIPIAAPVVDKAEESLKDQETAKKVGANESTQSNSNQNFEETNPGNSKHAEKYLVHQAQVNAESKETHHSLETTCLTVENNQPYPKSFINKPAETPYIEPAKLKVPTDPSTVKETEKDGNPKSNINIPVKVTATSIAPTKAAQKTAPTERLTAKVEYGNRQVEIELTPEKSNSDNKPEPSLVGRLPREHALELISRYRDYPELWHPEHANYTSRRLRRTAWRALAKDINKNLNTDFNWLQVQRKILDYVKYYRHERRRVQNKGGCTQWSFYDNFKFLEKVISPPTDLEKRVEQREQTIQIIELYKEYPQMWNTRHPQYTKRHQRQRSITQMRERLQLVYNINMEDTKLKQRLLELRKDYRSAKFARVAAERRNETFEALPHFEFYEHLQFLEEHVPPFNCLECKMEFKCFTDYNVHMRKEHKDYRRVQSQQETNDENAIKNVCHICGIKFTLRHNLLQHLNRHYTGRTLACSVCGKKFFTKNSLTEHERIHTKIPAVICPDCGQTFVNASKLNQHMKRHRNQRDHKCDQCNKSFYSAFDRDRHVQRHLQIRDKICPVCGKAFLMGSSYYAHMKLHSDKKEYVCNFCGKEFAQYAGLYKHRKRYHPSN